jgi:hypothetical protein
MLCCYAKMGAFSHGDQMIVASLDMEISLTDNNHLKSKDLVKSIALRLATILLLRLGRLSNH